MATQESSHGLPEALQSLLEAHWGFATLRPHQMGPVLDLHQGHHVLALMPTAGGKSLCFQLPALARGGLCIVITPLVALMEDQCQTLRERGIRAEAWVGNNGDRVLDNVRFGNTQFLYMSPERIGHPFFQARHEHWDVRTVVVDEAHCISQWGHDFRPAFQSIQDLRPLFPQAVWGAYTATATSAVVDDMSTQLPQGLRIHRCPMRRTNLHHQVCTYGDREATMLSDVQRQEGQGLIYVQSRHESERWGQRLQSLGIRGASYHAGLPAKEKQRRQRQWQDGTLQVLACTSAFGMGIDAPHVTWVFHAGPPANMESYIQEAGRAGRDGGSADCILFAEPKDFDLLRQRIEAQFPGKKEIQKAYQWAANRSYATPGEQPKDAFEVPDKALFPALKLLALAGHFEWTEPRMSSDLAGTVRWLGRLEDVDVDATHHAVASWLTRHATGKALEVNLTTWAKQLSETSSDGWTAEGLQLALETMDARGWLDWTPQVTSVTLRWLRPRQATHTVTVDTSRKAVMLSKLDGMEAYAFGTTSTCRAWDIEDVFGQREGDPCGRCDRCTLNRKHLRSELQNALNQGDVHPSEWIAALAPGHRQAARELMATWYRAGTIEANSDRIRWSRDPNGS